MQKILDYVSNIDPHYKLNGTWYAGITNNPDRRRKEHENEKNIVCKYFKHWVCPNENAARKVEWKLGLNGFAICKAKLKTASVDENYTEEEESKFVYVYKAIEK